MDKSEIVMILMIDLSTESMGGVVESVRSIGDRRWQIKSLFLLLFFSFLLLFRCSKFLVPWGGKVGECA